MFIADVKKEKKKKKKKLNLDWQVPVVDFVDISTMCCMRLTHFSEMKTRLMSAVFFNFRPKTYFSLICYRNENACKSYFFTFLLFYSFFLFLSFYRKGMKI